MLKGSKQRPTSELWPNHRYGQHKSRARHSNIPFTLTFEEWYDIWLKSGHYEERGNGPTNYVMSRYGDKGGYEVGNVFIQTKSQNTKDAQVGRSHDDGRSDKFVIAMANKPLLRCEHCSLMTRNPGNLRQHIRTHSLTT